MAELRLKFRDDSGDRSVAVASAAFTVGRQSGNDLTIGDGRLSRTHLKIDRFGDVFVASDCGSSNGTTLNGAPLIEPASLRDGDRLSLGGFEIVAELIAAPVEERRPRRTAAAAPSENSGFSSIPTAALLAAPILVILALVCGGGALFFFGGGDIVKKDEPRITRTPVEDETPEEDVPDASPTPSATRSATNDSPGSPLPTAPPVSDETRKVEENSAKFLRKIALSDPNAFLASPQIEILKARIGPLRGSSALGANIKAVKNSAAQFESMASAQGLKPQFLAAAALAKIGNTSGDPIATARAMLPFLADLRISLGNSLADDNLLMMADYLRRERKEGRSLQSILEGIPRSDIGDADPREIRTIWFLRKNKKISEEGYELALRFLAIGTIMQNPGDFNVKAEPITF
jgi:predicted component of type VI protein secretion system